MWELDCEESWAPKIDAFELWCWRRLLRVPWTARTSNQSILKETSPGCSLEGLMLKLKLQYFGHLMRRADSLKRPWCWERLGAGGEGDDRGWDGWMASLTQWTWIWVDSGSWWWTGRPGVLWFMGSQRVGHDWETELNWTLSWGLELNLKYFQRLPVLINNTLLTLTFETIQTSILPKFVYPFSLKKKFFFFRSWAMLYSAHCNFSPHPNAIF